MAERRRFRSPEPPLAAPGGGCDVTGMPLDPEHAWNRDQGATPEFLREASIQRKLERCRRAWKAQMLPALRDTVRICERERRPLPGWANEGVLKIIQEHFAASTQGRMGRTANRESEYRQNMIHYTRWDMVQELRDRPDLGDIASTFAEAYQAVSEKLRRTPWAGSPEAVKASFELVERAMRTGKALHFYLSNEVEKPASRK